MKGSVSEFYDKFEHTFVRDLVFGNRRVKAIHRLFRQAVPPDVPRILLIGCGPGRDAWELAEKVAPRAEILAVYISENNIRIARALFSHPRITFQCTDILESRLEGQWPYIILPDVYEHIPRERRNELHRMIQELLTPDGRIIMTCPTPSSQQMMRESGKLQIIDENVTFADIQEIAEVIGGGISLYRLVSIWYSNDYFHAIIERDLGYHPLDSPNLVEIKGNPPATFGDRLYGKFCTKRIQDMIHERRYRKIQKKLLDAGIALNCELKIK